MTRHLWLAPLALILLVGCGGSGPIDIGPDPPASGTTGDTVQVGPLVIRPASTAGFVVDALGLAAENCSFAAVHGAQIDCMASVALLDRIVFASSRDGYFDIWACDLDGSNLVQLTNNNATELAPEWSADGRMITSQREWPGQDTEVMVMNADGTGIRALTDNAARDEQPTFNHDGRRIAFHTDRVGNFEVYAMYADGGSPTNLSNNAAVDGFPNWSWAYERLITFVSGRDGNMEVYKMTSEGQSQTRVTNTLDNEYSPSWSTAGSYITFARLAPDFEIFQMTNSGANDTRFSNTPETDEAPCYSIGDRYIAYAGRRGGTFQLILQETEAPNPSYQLTDGSSANIYPDLGSPTVQTERVLIGPPGSDWGGADPIWSSAYAGICAYDVDGYRNFVRVGIATGDLPTLRITPVSTRAWGLVGVLIEAREIVNLREDAGRLRDPTVWQLDPLSPEAALLYFSATTGKLTSVMTVRDSLYPAGDAARPVERLTPRGLVVEGEFTGVFDASGRNLAAAGATSVLLDDAGAPTVLR